MTEITPGSRLLLVGTDSTLRQLRSALSAIQPAPQIITQLLPDIDEDDLLQQIHEICPDRVLLSTTALEKLKSLGG